MMDGAKDKVLLFGASQAGIKFVRQFVSRFNVLGFVDNDPGKQGRSVKGFNVISPDRISEITYDYIVLTSTATAEIIPQLLGMGIADERILLSHAVPPFGRYVPLIPEFGAIVPALIRYCANGVERLKVAELIRDCRRISMLSPEVLLLLRYFAAQVEGRVLEIGAYVGGATIAMAEGAREQGAKPVIVIEPGGAHESHPQIPSSDIFGDLRRNLGRAGASVAVQLLHGRSNEEKIVARVFEEVGEAGIGMLVIDADGHVDRDFGTFLPLLRKGCLVVLDDYESDYAASKASLVKPWVDKQVSAGLLSPIGIVPWGTWIGRVA